MTALLYLDYSLGHKIICNYKVNFDAKYMSFEKVATLPKELEGATLGFDELGIGADSRNFFSKRNNNLGKLIMQLRKRKCLMYYTVQRLNLIDKRIRQQTDQLILMEKTPQKGKFLLRVIESNTSLLISKSIFNGDKIWDLYDTNEIIELEGVDEND